jgi:hypothetical protein
MLMEQCYLLMAWYHITLVLPVVSHGDTGLTD